MEIVVGVAVIGILMLILGFGIDIMIFVFVGLLLLMTAGSAAVLLYFAVRLMFSKKCEGSFVRIGRTEKRKYDIAFYITESGELPNVFPAEVVMKNRLYDSEKKLKLRIDAGKKFVYDRNARLTIILGAPLSTLLSVMLVLGMMLMMTNYP